MEPLPRRGESSDDEERHYSHYNFPRLFESHTRFLANSTANSLPNP